MPSFIVILDGYPWIPTIFFYGKLGNCGSGDRREMEGGNRRLGVSGNCGQDVNRRNYKEYNH